MKILVGLGNPGAEYENSRHNLGFMVMDAFARSLAFSFRKSSPRLVTAHGAAGHEKLILAKPLTYMNRSGAAVLELIEKTGAGFSDLLVIHDDLDLGLGRLRIKTKGGHGGHRGVQSIIASLKAQQFYRLRIGIGRPPAHLAADEYVLSAFLPEERSLANEMIQRSVSALDCFIREGPEAAMNRYNLL
ncbi:MAG: aminoacyl-tRNA hydrolase [Nitrospirae bacterium]|nr:aminoacyl-tRNA hydrolase [Nitrospirota bacterium]